MARNSSSKVRRIDGPIMIGHERIYPTQCRLGRKVMDRLRLNELPTTEVTLTPLMVLQQQEGKTGGMIYVINAFVADCVKRKRTFQIIVINGISDTTLIEQTRDRMKIVQDGSSETRGGADLDMTIRATGLARYDRSLGSALGDGIVFQSCTSRLKRLTFNTMPLGMSQEPDVRLWVIDEAHLGNGLDGNIDSILRKHGINISKPPHSWDQAVRNHVVVVSATPAAHLLKTQDFSSIDESLFDVCHEPAPVTYNSMKIMRDNGRLRQVNRDIVGSGQLEKEILPAFAARCKAEGPGYLVIRAQGKKYEALVDLLKTKKYRHETFDCKRKNISEFLSKLRTKPDCKQVLIIRGSMRAGMTIKPYIDTPHFIHGWVENHATNPDSQAQSGVGRACGHNKVSETYPIWCDLDNINQWIDVFDALDNRLTNGAPLMSVPKGIKNRAHNNNGGRKVYPICEIIPAPYKSLGIRPQMTAKQQQTALHQHPVYVERVYPFSALAVRNGNAAPQLMAKIRGLSREQRQVVIDKQRKQIAICSLHIQLDQADLVLNQTRDSGGTIAVYLDGPTTKATVRAYLNSKNFRNSKHTEADVWAWYRRNLESFARLRREHPEYEGAICVYDLSGATRAAPKQGNLSLLDSAAIKSR